MLGQDTPTTEDAQTAPKTGCAAFLTVFWFELQCAGSVQQLGMEVTGQAFPLPSYPSASQVTFHALAG